MITIAISLLFGLTAFVALLTITLNVLRGMERGREILVELGQIDARSGRKISRSGRIRQEAFAPLWPHPHAAA